MHDEERRADCFCQFVNSQLQGIASPQPIAERVAPYKAERRTATPKRAASHSVTCQLARHLV